MDNEREEVQEALESEAAAKEDAPKKKSWFLRHKIAVAVTLVVVAAAGVGFGIWHNTPHFCGAICHHPQDPYNPTYYAEPGQPATDKWGNHVANASGMLAATHRAKGDLVCMDCHEPSIREQVTEGLEWLTDDFYYPLSERNFENLVFYRKDAAPEEFCLNENCHDYTKATLSQVYADSTRNPHSWHHAEYTCNDCHKSHRASIMVCSGCHQDAMMPEGWLTLEESRELDTIFGYYDDEEK